MAWDDISDILSEEGQEKVSVGEILAFEQEGERQEYKIMRKAQGKVWVKKHRTFTPDEVNHMLAQSEKIVAKQRKAQRKQKRQNNEL